MLRLGTFVIQFFRRYFEFIVAQLVVAVFIEFLWAPFPISFYSEKSLVIEVRAQTTLTTLPASYHPFTKVIPDCTNLAYPEPVLLSVTKNLRMVKKATDL